jgi:hypothetical protein
MKLQRLGFTDQAFWRLHHFREKGKKATINGVRSYCEKTNSFLGGGNNERVYQHLKRLLEN